MVVLPLQESYKVYSCNLKGPSLGWLGACLWGTARAGPNGTLDILASSCHIPAIKRHLKALIRRCVYY